MEVLATVWAWIVDLMWENKWAAVLAIYAIVRASGITIDSGQTGLKFSFGRATRELKQGFHIVIPFVQKVRVVPTRSRTLDIPRQRVTTLDGLALLVETNLVYRIVDVRKALVQIDNLQKGILQTFGLSVQQVLRGLDGQTARVSKELEGKLEAVLSERLSDWGVQVERAGLTSITPSNETLRVTQLHQRAMARHYVHRVLAEVLPARRAVMILGARTEYVRRGVSLRQNERRRRADRAIIALMRSEYTREQIHAAQKRCAQTAGSTAARKLGLDDDE